jgi:hypothetical protein
MQSEGGIPMKTYVKSSLLGLALSMLIISTVSGYPVVKFTNGEFESWLPEGKLAYWESQAFVQKVVPDGGNAVQLGRTFFTYQDVLENGMPETPPFYTPLLSQLRLGRVGGLTNYSVGTATPASSGSISQIVNLAPEYYTKYTIGITVVKNKGMGGMIIEWLDDKGKSLGSQYHSYNITDIPERDEVTFSRPTDAYSARITFTKNGFSMGEVVIDNALITPSSDGSGPL